MNREKGLGQRAKGLAQRTTHRVEGIEFGMRNAEVGSDGNGNS